MKRMLAAAAGASLLMVLGGCGGGDNKVTEATSDPGAAGAAGGTSLAGSGDAGRNDTPDTPLGDAGSNAPDDGAPEMVTPRPGMSHLRPVSWESAKVLGDRTVRITFYGGVEPCDVLDSVKVKYGTNAVAVSLFSGSDPAKPDAVCIQIAKLKAVEVTLTEDIGDRELKDGAPDSGGGSKTNAPAASGKIRGDTPAVALSPKPGQDSAHAITWDRYELIDPTTVRVYFMSGVEPCDVLDHIKLVYAQQVIRVAVFLGSDPTQKGAVCPMLARSAFTDVKLSEPVGDREVVDDTTTD